jgi:hypothetical protein
MFRTLVLVLFVWSDCLPIVSSSLQAQSSIEEGVEKPKRPRRKRPRKPRVEGEGSEQVRKKRRKRPRPSKILEEGEEKLAEVVEETPAVPQVPGRTFGFSFDAGLQDRTFKGDAYDTKAKGGDIRIGTFYSPNYSTLIKTPLGLGFNYRVATGSVPEADTSVLEYGLDFQFKILFAVGTFLQAGMDITYTNIMGGKALVTTDFVEYAGVVDGGSAMGYGAIFHLFFTDSFGATLGYRMLSGETDVTFKEQRTVSTTESISNKSKFKYSGSVPYLGLIIAF